MRAVFIIVVLLMPLACTPRTLTQAPAKKQNECVVLLHGLARSAESMDKIELALRANGYQTANIDYESADATIAALTKEAIGSGLKACQAFEPKRIHFVTHSLGGILVRYYLEAGSINNLGRTVMLAPPNQGSEAADFFMDFPGFEALFGESGRQLGTGPDSIPRQLGPAHFDVGIIAGDRTIDPISSLVLPNPDDGKVSVKSTRLEGMSDFIVVPHSHAFIMKNDEVIRQILFFLQNGQFDRSSDEAQTDNF